MALIFIYSTKTQMVFIVNITLASSCPTLSMRSFLLHKWRDVLFLIQWALNPPSRTFSKLLNFPVPFSVSDGYNRTFAHFWNVIRLLFIFCLLESCYNDGGHNSSYPKRPIMTVQWVHYQETQNSTIIK